MPMRINPKTAFLLPGGGISTPGVIVTVPEAFGAEVVGARRAEDVDLTLWPGREIAVVKNVSNGALISLDGLPVDASAKPKIAVRSDTISMGDSLLYLPNNTNGVVGSGGCYSDSHILWCNDRLNRSIGAQLDVVSYLAVGGMTLAQVRDTQLAAALASPARTFILHAGANSLNVTLGNASISQAISDLQDSLDELSAAKDGGIVDAIQPVNQGGITGLKGRAYEIPEFNRIARELCASYPNVRLFDAYTPLLDPTSTVLNAKASTLNVTDGIHYLLLGAMATGYPLAEFIAQNFTITPYRSAGPNLLPSFSGSGGTATPGAGTITGAPPAGYNVEVKTGSAAVTITQPVAGTTRLAMTNAGATPSVVYLQTTAATAAALLAAVATGDVLQAGIDFTATAITNCSRLAAVITQRNGPTLWVAGATNSTPSSDQAPVLPNVGISGLRKQFPYLLPSGTTALDYIVSFALGASTGAMTVDLKLPSFVKLT